MLKLRRLLLAGVMLLALVREGQTAPPDTPAGTTTVPATTAATTGPAATAATTGPAATAATTGPAATAATTGPAATAATTVPAATAATTGSVRSGDHPGFGRVVIDMIGNTAYRLDQDGDHVTVRMAANVSLGQPPAPPRNVLAIRIDGPTVDLTLKHGAKLHPSRMNGHVLFDIFDPSTDVPPVAKEPADAPTLAANPTRTASSIATVTPLATPAPIPTVTTAALPKPPKTEPLRLHPPLAMATSPELAGRSTPATPVPPPEPMTAARPPVEAAQLPALVNPPSVTTPGLKTPDAKLPNPIAPDPKAFEETQQTAPGRDVLPENMGPVGLLARRVKLPKGIEGAAFLVPFDSTTGAAAFTSGDATYVVLDERRPVDMAALRNDKLFSKVTVQLLPSGTLFRIPLPPDRSLALTQMSQGWRIAALTTPPKLQPIVATQVEGRLSLAAEQPGDVISLADPDTGATLLVGTQHRPGQGVPTSRRGTEFVLRKTMQGVVVEPLADEVVLKQVATGFSLTGAAQGLLLSPQTGLTDVLMDAAHLTRRFDFSPMPPEALMRRATRQFDEAAAAPPLARGAKHHLAAESLMALGLFAEAQSLLLMAAEQDPKEAASADTAGLTAIAALLAGRPDESSALSDPRLDGSDEVTLWRGIRQAMADHGSPAAAAAFATTAPLIFQYPKAIREHILPLMVETMIEGGEIASAKRLLDQRKTDPKLAYARGLMQQAEGNTDEALAVLDEVTNGRDQFDHARAAVRAVELRLSARKLDKTQAADALDKLLYVWRGDARELALRERVAELRGQIGAWPVALTTLRQAETDFPEQAVLIHERLKDTFAAMIRDQGEHQTPAIEFVAAVDENTDLMPDPGDDETVQQALSDRLLALDLPERAKPVLGKLIKFAKSDDAKARFGLTLAKLDLREGDDAGAQAALIGSEGHDLDPDLTEQRTILRAGATARLGDAPAAVALLAPFHTDPAIQARAEILEKAGQWPAAEQAWTESVALTVSDTGPVDEVQVRTLLRLATATARASDDSGLADLRLKYTARLGPGPLADMFRVLTAEPIKTSADIKRSQAEMSLAATLPADMKAFQAGTTAR